MSLRHSRRRRPLGLATGLLLSCVVLACLNPRPDDQPLFRSPGASAPIDVPSTGAGFGDSQDPGQGAAGSTGSADPSTPSNNSNSGNPGADAGVPPDAGPEDDEDAGALAD